ncbi:nitroreductase family deazaflavin-dependent oxidoreductase [Microbacter sp. GSS18]|nr:nitroreductase family deazaflavin-dependent oxidoreductase [Microbacter sp. GSS18]
MKALRILSRALGGALLVNAVPHGVSGLQGRPFPTPFADPPGVGMSPPVTNIAWSAMNLVGGLLVLRRGIRSRGEAVAVVVGGIASVFVVAAHFGSVMSGGTGLTARGMTSRGMPARGRTARGMTSRGSGSPLQTARRLTEPVARSLAGHRAFPLWAVIHHRGRRSGAEYATPIAVVPTYDEGVVLIGLPYGLDTNWARNVVAAGGATLAWKGAEHRTSAARIIDADEAAALAKAPFHAVVKRMPGAILLERD